MPRTEPRPGQRDDGTMPESNKPDYSRYPEVAAVGGLRTPLQETFDTTGMPLTAQHVESPGWLSTHAVVRAADRQVYVHMRPGDRAFVGLLRRLRVTLLSGLTPGAGARSSRQVRMPVGPLPLVGIWVQFVGFTVERRSIRHSCE
jgi:hypothetical protein